MKLFNFYAMVSLFLLEKPNLSSFLTFTTTSVSSVSRMTETRSALMVEVDHWVTLGSYSSVSAT